MEDNKQEDSDEFEAYANSPDIKLKSIDIDETFTKKKPNDDGISDDNSGTGHKAIPKKNLVAQNSYGTEASS